MGPASGPGDPRKPSLYRAPGWNRQRRDEVLLDVEDVAAGYKGKMSWNDRSEWIWSAELTHEPLITPETFASASAQRSVGEHRQAVVKPPAPAHLLSVPTRPLRRLRAPHVRGVEPQPGVLPMHLPHRVRRDYTEA